MSTAQLFEANWNGFPVICAGRADKQEEGSYTLLNKLLQHETKIMRITFGTILATAFLLLLSPRCSANSDELLQKVQAEADQSAEALGGEVDLSFSASVKWAVPNLPRMVSEDGKVQILGANLRYSFERVFPVDEGRGEFRSQEEVSFDGSRYYIGSFHLTRPGVRVLSAGTSPVKDLRQQEVKSCLYLESAGFTLPKRVAEFQ